MPFFELGEGAVADRIGARVVEEADRFGVEDTGRLSELFLGVDREGGESGDSKEKGEARHGTSAVLGGGMAHWEKRLDSGVYNFGPMLELTQVQKEMLERLFEAGFRPIAIPPYENALCVHRGEYAAVLAAVENGGLRLLAPATVMVDGNLGVKLKRGKGDVFVWKQKEVAATEERLKELEKFREELARILESHKL